MSGLGTVTTLISASNASSLKMDLLSKSPKPGSESSWSDKSDPGCSSKQKVMARGRAEAVASVGP